MSQSVRGLNYVWDVTYQTRTDRISKRRKKSWNYDMQRNIFDECWCVKHGFEYSIYLLNQYQN